MNEKSEKEEQYLFEQGLKPAWCISIEKAEKYYNHYPYQCKLLKRNSIILFQDQEKLLDFKKELFLKVDEIGNEYWECFGANLGKALGYPPKAITYFYSNEHEEFKEGKHPFTKLYMNYGGLHFVTKAECLEEDIMWLQTHIPLPIHLQDKIFVKVVCRENQAPSLSYKEQTLYEQIPYSFFIEKIYPHFQTRDIHSMNTLLKEKQSNT